MAEFRRDPITGRCVIIATNRAQRPREYHVERRVRDGGHCPFCEGHEADTPEEVLASRPRDTDPNGPGWRVRVVPNKYPALIPIADFAAVELAAMGEAADWDRDAGEFFGCKAANGIHEVIVESPEHIERTADLNEYQLAEVFRIYRDRLHDLRSDKTMRFGVAFKNVGPEAGATIQHTHSQLIGLPILPPLVAEELGAMTAHYKSRDRCLLCDLIQAELAVDRRIVGTTDNFVAICPYAARLPYETWILPRRHQSDFDAMDDRQCAQVAEMLLCVCRSIDAALDAPAYNYAILTAPFDTDTTHHYHWRIVIIPRMTVMAGFEWSTGCHINPVAPEKSAQQLQLLKNVRN